MPVQVLYVEAYKADGVGAEEYLREKFDLHKFPEKR